MKRLWAPWRMEFLDNCSNEKTEGCILCTIISQKRDIDNYVLYRGSFAIILMNKYPYNNGHLMVVPNRHTDDFTSLSNEELAELYSLTRHCIMALKEIFNPHGFNTGMNLGYAAGAGIKDHIHEHVVPRWIGDFNFMPVIGEIKAIPQHLLQTYERLLPYFRRLKNDERT